MTMLPDDPLWLEICTGWEVRSDEGLLGVVERVEPDPESDEPRYLAIRGGRIVVLLVPLDEVYEVLPEERLIVLGPNSSRLVPELRGDQLVLCAPAASLVAR
jgi:hypothetical protein